MTTPGPATDNVPFIPEKSPLRSVTVWGSLLALLGLLLQSLGLGEITETEQARLSQHIVAALDQVLILVGGVTAIIGRFRAKTKVTLQPNGKATGAAVLLLIGFAVLTGGCQTPATTAEQAVFDAHAAEANAFAGKVDAISHDELTPEQWSAVQSWIHSQSRTLDAFAAWARGAYATPQPQTGDPTDAHDHTDDPGARRSPSRSASPAHPTAAQVDPGHRDAAHSSHRTHGTSRTSASQPDTRTVGRGHAGPSARQLDPAGTRPHQGVARTSRSADRQRTGRAARDARRGHGLGDPGGDQDRTHRRSGVNPTA